LNPGIVNDFGSCFAYSRHLAHSSLWHWSRATQSLLLTRGRRSLVRITVRLHSVTVALFCCSALSWRRSMEHCEPATGTPSKHA